MDQYEIKFPRLPWRAPMPLHAWADSADEWLGCRICIARHGLKTANLRSVPYCFNNADDHRKHMEGEHAESQQVRPGSQ